MGDPSPKRNRGGKILVAGLLALLGPLPLPHVDTYLPAALGLVAAVMALGRDGPTYLLLMVGVLVVYGLASYFLVSLIARLGQRWAHRRSQLR